MGFWDTFKANPAPVPEPVPTPVHGNVVGAPMPVEDAPPRMAQYHLVGVWGFDRETRTRTDEIDTSSTGYVELSGGRRATVGDTVEMTRAEAAQVGEVFALSLVL